MYATISDVLKALHLYCVHHDELTETQRDDCVRTMSAHAVHYNLPPQRTNVEHLYRAICHCQMPAPEGASEAVHHQPS